MCHSSPFPPFQEFTYKETGVLSSWSIEGEKDGQDM
jgi:hypothetical protein